MPLRPPTRLHRAALRGFTLLEMMTVVIIITVFAAIAIPLTTQQVRERRVLEAADRVASLYRTARLRAMGRGSAVLVRFSPGTRGRFEVLEAQRGNSAEAGCEALPISSCLSPNWNGPVNTDYRSLQVLDLAIRSEYDRVNIALLDRSETAVANLDVCFTPMGRAFARKNTAEPLATLSETHVAEVWRGEGTARLGRTRRVVILPNGTARVD